MAVQGFQPYAFGYFLQRCRRAVKGRGSIAPLAPIALRHPARKPRSAMHAGTCREEDPWLQGVSRRESNPRSGCVSLQLCPCSEAQAGL